MNYPRVSQCCLRPVFAWRRLGESWPRLLSFQAWDSLHLSVYSWAAQNILKGPHQTPNANEDTYLIETVSYPSPPNVEPFCQERGSTLAGMWESSVYVM